MKYDADERGFEHMKSRDFSFFIGLFAGIPVGMGILAIVCVMAQ